MALWLKPSVEGSDIYKTWAAAYINAESRLESRWHNVTGIIGATVNSLFDIGRQPLRPDLWTSFDGQKWQLFRESDVKVSIATQPVKEALVDTIQTIYWTDASDQHNAGGIDHTGIDLISNRRLYRFLYNK